MRSCCAIQPKSALCGYFDRSVRTSFEGSNVYVLEMRKVEGSSLSAALRASIERLKPTADFRRRAWREFQRSLDPLAPPKRLPPARS